MRQINENVSAKGNKDRNCYAISQITNTFLTLLKEKGFDSISISNKVCGVAVLEKVSEKCFFIQKYLDILSGMVKNHWKVAKYSSII